MGQEVEVSIMNSTFKIINSCMYFNSLIRPIGDLIVSQFKITNLKTSTLDEYAT